MIRIRLGQVQVLSTIFFWVKPCREESDAVKAPRSHKFMGKLWGKEFQAFARLQGFGSPPYHHLEHVSFDDFRPEKFVDQLPTPTDCSWMESGKR